MPVARFSAAGVGVKVFVGLSRLLKISEPMQKGRVSIDAALRVSTPDVRFPQRHGQNALRPINPLKIVMNTIFMSNQNDQLWI
jgi:hypothetical protein